MDSNDNEGNVKIKSDEDVMSRWYKLKVTVFLSSLTGCSILAGFGLTMGMAKKNDPSHFAKGLMTSKELPESGVVLAAKALGKATVYNFIGFGLIGLVAWKVLGINSMDELKLKLGNAFPKIKKKEGTGRNDFATIRDFYDYIIAEDGKSKKAKIALKELSTEQSGQQTTVQDSSS